MNQACGADLSIECLFWDVVGPMTRQCGADIIEYRAFLHEIYVYCRCKAIIYALSQLQGYETYMEQPYEHVI